MFRVRELTGNVLLRIWLVFTTALGACHAGPPHAAAHAPVTVWPPPVEVLTCVDLPRDDPRSHELSGLAWDPAEQLLYAVSDRTPWIVVLAPRADLSAYELREPIGLGLPVARWDGEAIALAGDRFLLVADETEPAVFSVQRDGRGGMRVALPWFAGVRRNLGLEGLGYVASPQRALRARGQRASARGRLRHSLDGGADLEVAYLTDPIFAAGPRGDNGCPTSRRFRPISCSSSSALGGGQRQQRSPLRGRSAHRTGCARCR